MIQLICDYMKRKILVFSIMFLAIDILSKVLIKTNLNLYDSITLIPNFFNITYVLNDGAAFSLFQGKQILFIILGIIFLGILIYYIFKEKLTNYKVIYYSLLIGGVVGNILDRIIYKNVVDFLDFKIFSYDAPIFNLADTFIVIGVGLILIEIIRKDTYGKNKSNR